VLEGAHADPYRGRVSLIGLSKNDRREGAEFARAEISHPPGANRLSSADDALHGAREIILGNDAVDCCKEMAKRSLPNPAAASSIAGDPSPGVPLNGMFLEAGAL